MSRATKVLDILESSIKNLDSVGLLEVDDNIQSRVQQAKREVNEFIGFVNREIHYDSRAIKAWGDKVESVAVNQYAFKYLDKIVRDIQVSLNADISMLGQAFKKGNEVSTRLSRSFK